MNTQKKQLPTEDYDRMVRTTCPSCGAGCGLKVFLREGRAMAIYGDEENQLNKGALCPRGLGALYQLDPEKRIQKPFFRNHLSESFRPVTWEEALDHVTEKLSRIKGRYSTESVYFHLTPHSGFGNMVLGKKLGELWGSPNVEDDFSPESSPAGVVLRRMLGIPFNGCAMSSRHEWSSSQAMLIVGVDPASTDPVALGPILDAKDRGTQIIVLDSRNTITMGKAHLRLKCRVGTETAVLLSMAHTLLRENLYHHEFLERWVEGVEEFSSLCQQYSPADAEKISGVKKEDILLSARVLAKKFPSMVIGHSRVSSRSACAGLVYAMVSLVALTGTVGCPGGGLNLFNNFPPLDNQSQVASKPGGQKKGLVRAGSGSMIWRALTEGRPYPIRAVIWDNNPLAFCPRGREVREALKKMELIVHLSRYPNLTFEHSHVVFPIASFLETEGLVFSGVGRNLQWANRVVEPLGECRPADDFWGGLFERFLLASPYPFIGEEGRVDIRDMTRFFLSAQPLTSGIRPDLLDPEKNQPGGIQWPAMEGELDFSSSQASVRGLDKLFQPGRSFPGTDRRFPTPTGKINLSPEEISGEEGFEKFIPGEESERAWKGKRFFLVTGETVDYVPSAGFWATPQKPEKPLFLQIHPKRAQEMGLQQGESIIVENKWGKIQAPAWVTDQVDEETIFCPLGADPYDPRFPFESPINLMDFVPGEEGCGRRGLEKAEVKVRKA